MVHFTAEEKLLSLACGAKSMWKRLEVRLWAGRKWTSWGKMVLNTTASPFLLTGFPGMEKAHHWISIPLLVVYISILLGSGTLLFLIRDYHNLHEPMYYFLAMVAATNHGVTLTRMPKVLGILWLNHREISHRVCFSQAYFIHTLSIIESNVLLAMAWWLHCHLQPLEIYFHPDQQRGNKDWDGGIDKGGSVNYTNNSSPSLVPLLLIPCTLSYFLSTLRCHQFTVCQYHLQSSLSCRGCIRNGLIGLPCHLFLLHFDPQDCHGHCFWRIKGQGPQHICCILVFYVTVVGLIFIHRFGDMLLIWSTSRWAISTSFSHLLWILSSTALKPSRSRLV